MEKHVPKGYWIAHNDVTDAEAYKGYVAANGPIFAKYGARFLVRAGKFEAVEGEARGRHVVIEFPDYVTALACYHSPEYAAAMKIRKNASAGSVVVVEGYDPP